jgi:hypothetical protein
MLEQIANAGMRRNIFPKAAKYAVRHCRVHCCKRSAIEGQGIKMNRVDLMKISDSNYVSRFWRSTSSIIPRTSWQGKSCSQLK